MFRELFVNFAILATLLFFGNMFFNHFRKASKNSALKAWLPWGAGLALGLVGIVLMGFSFRIGANSILDLRQTAIIIAVYVAGIPGGLIASLLIVSFRFFFFGPPGMLSYVGAANAIVTFLWVALVIKKGQLKPWKWAAAFAVQFIVLTLSLSISIGTETLDIVPVYAVITIGTGIFTFFMLRHFNNSNELFAFMEDAAHRDFLTGLHNTRSFHLAYDRRVKSALKSEEGFGLILLDIDHFKQVNDTYGHQAGDLVLRQLGTILSSCCPADGYCARNGGEEFAVLLDRADEEIAGRLAERIRTAVKGYSFLMEDGTRLELTVSLGFGLSTDGSPKTLFRRVDDALYRSKESGRNRTSQAFSEVLPSAARKSGPPSKS